MSDLKKLAIKATVWTFIGYGSIQILRLISNLILTRLLDPKLFGLMTLVNTFIMGLQTLSDVGIGPSIIQNKRAEEEQFYNTAWTIQVFRGIILWLLSCLIAWPVSSFYNNHQLLYLIPIIGLSMIINGFTSTSIFILNRRLEIAKLTIYDLSAYIIQLIVMIIWAALEPSVWALVAGTLTFYVIKMIGSFKLIPNFSNRFGWDKSSAREIFSFGKWIFISTAFTFIALQSDKLILAKVASLKILGVYSIALIFALLPQTINNQISVKVIFPVLSRKTDLPRPEFRSKIIKTRAKFLLLGIIFISLLVSFGDQLILHFYDKRYVQASWMLPILALGIWPNLLSETGRSPLIALGKANYQAWGQIFKSIHMIVGLLLGYHFFGLLGFIIVVALNDIGLYSAISYGLIKERLTCLGQDLWTTLLLILTISLLLTLRYSLGFGTPIDVLLSSNLR